MQKTIQISTSSHNGRYDITREVESVVSESGVRRGLVNVCVQGATAGIMIWFKFMYPLVKMFSKSETYPRRIVDLPTDLSGGDNYRR